MIEAYCMLDGRLRRRGYLGYSLLLWLVLALLSALAWAIASQLRSSIAQLIASLVVFVFWAWAVAALRVKRLHDLDRSGWHFIWMTYAPILLLYAVGALSFTFDGGDIGWHIDAGLPSVALVVYFLGGEVYLLVTRGTDGPNRFGYRS
jgi:uncharacterized membrane protein YhaH (DUF805 family)